MKIFLLKKSEVIEFLLVPKQRVVGFSKNEKMDRIGFIKSRKSREITPCLKNSSVEKDFGYQNVKKIFITYSRNILLLLESWNVNVICNNLMDGKYCEMQYV